MSEPCICIIGLGLIGGSFAAALKKAGFSGRIQAVVRSEHTVVRALEQGLVDSCSLRLSDGVAGADVIMLAVPMLAMRQQLEDLASLVDEQTVITDAGSVKGKFIKDAQANFASLRRIVPGHPIAGREKSGIDAVDDSLFAGRRVLLTPVEQTDADATDQVRRLWQLTGADVEVLNAEQHDRVLAATSHLPHVLAFALVDSLATRQEAEEIFRYAAGGFRDFSRIASSDPIMWRDICLTNRDAILESMSSLEVHLQKLRFAIERGDSEAIESTFSRAKQARDTFMLTMDTGKTPDSNNT